MLYLLVGFIPLFMEHIFFFCPFTFSLYISLYLNWVSYRQHISGSFKKFYSATLFLLKSLFICFSSVQLLSCVWLFETPWITACQASLSITNPRSLLKLMSIESVMPSSHLILCCPHLLLPSIFPSIRVFSSESVLHIRWPNYWSFSFNDSPSNEYSGLISLELTGLNSLQSRGLFKNLL